MKAGTLYLISLASIVGSLVHQGIATPIGSPLAMARNNPDRIMKREVIVNGHVIGEGTGPIPLGNFDHGAPNAGKLNDFGKDFGNGL